MSADTVPAGVPVEFGDLQGKRALVYSLGIEGRDLAAWLLSRGARVTISDTRTLAQLEAAHAAAPAGVERVVTGRGFLAPDGFDLLAVSQSVMRYDPSVVRARELHIPVTSQMRLFMQLCRGRMVGITGSSGKSTTTALAGAIAREAEVDAIVGGNIGEPLLGRLGSITPATTVILEISHSQLQYTDRSPAIAAVTNVTPNHLDQFSWDEYVGLKRHILSYQSRRDVAVMSDDDHTSRALMAAARGRLVRVSAVREVAGDGAWVEGGRVRWRKGTEVEELFRTEELKLRGGHNLANAVMASAIAAEAGFPLAAIRAAVCGFRGVPHRLEVVGTAGGATWVNDSIATSPERTAAGLRAFSERVVLLLGGREKNLPLAVLQDLAAIRCRAIVCFGEAGPLFYEALRVKVPAAELVTALDDAVAAAARYAHAGDVVLFSPAGTSFDSYPSFEARGEAFRALVAALPGFVSEVAP